MGKFELFRSEVNRNFYFRFKSASGTQLLNSEGYTGKSSCQNAIDSVKKNAPIDGRYERKDNKDEKRYSFNLKAANGEIIARSTKVYETAQDRDDAIKTVKDEAPDAPVVDLS